MLSLRQRVTKRIFDIAVSLFGLVLLWPVISLAFLVAAMETKSNGFFLQRRVGKHGKVYNVFKIKTMKQIDSFQSTVTTTHDPRITLSGAFFRKSKIDELPQLLNVLLGQMSLVGPRPDVEGYADLLQGEDRVILELAPGITGPATLKYRDEEVLLSSQENPKRYNDEVIWPDKIKINKAYIQNWSFITDIKYLIETLRG